MNRYDFIGRASIDLSTLRTKTEFILDYKLYDTALFERRNGNGTIRVRKLLEIVCIALLSIKGLNLKDFHILCPLFLPTNRFVYVWRLTTLGLIS